jgi:hypothetical protein
MDPTVSGSVAVFIAAGSATSPVFSLDITPLPDTPGAMDTLLLALEAQLAAAAGLFGTDLQAIAQMSPEQALQTPQLVPLKYAYSLLDDNDRSTSLTGVLADGSSFLNGKERQFLDQLAGYMKLDQLAQLYIDVWSAELNGAGALANALEQPTVRVGQTAVLSVSPQNASARTIAACVDNPISGPLSPSELARYMTLATDSAIRSSAAGAALLNASSAAAGVSGSLLAAAGVVTAPVAAGAGAVLGGAFATHLAINGAVAGIYPSRFTDLTVNLSRSRFNLDFRDPGQYSNLQVTAASTGWIADGAISDFLTSAAGFSAVKSAKAADSVGEIMSGALEATTIATESSTYGLMDDGLFGVCPASWNVDITGDQWSTVIALNGIFSVAPLTRRYEPREVGSDVLRFFPKPDKFGFQQILRDMPVGVDDMEVSASPNRVKVANPGEEVAISARVQFADDNRLSWSSPYGSWQDGSNESDSPDVTKTLITPTDRSKYPFDVTISSLSERKLSSPTAVVEDVVTIEASRLFILPQYACLDSGQIEGFRAVNEQDEPVDVNWTLEGPDSISPTGTGSANYTAPQIGTGSSVTATIVATARESSTLKAEAQVDVGVCTCEWEALVNGTAASGDYSSHRFDGSTFPLSIDFQRGTLGESHAIFNAILSPGQTGTLADEGMSFQFNLGGTFACSAINDSEVENPTRVTLDIVENSGRVVRGTAYGTCGVQSYLDPENVTLSQFVISFRSNNFADLLNGGSICNASP